MSSGHLVQTADLRMHYLQRGTGEPVVLIHGFPRPLTAGDISWPRFRSIMQCSLLTPADLARPTNREFV